MKRLFLVVAAVGALWLPAIADARDWHGGFGALVQTQGQPMKKGPPPGQQFQRSDGDRRGGPDKGNQGRLTQEERRDLHRDLDRANREIYRRH